MSSDSLRVLLGDSLRLMRLGNILDHMSYTHWVTGYDTRRCEFKLTSFSPENALLASLVIVNRAFPGFFKSWIWSLDELDFMFADNHGIENDLDLSAHMDNTALLDAYIDELKLNIPS